MNFRSFYQQHTWWGKILGGFFGYIIAGSVGALVGIFIGNLFDKGLSSHFTSPHWAYNTVNRRLQETFYESLFSIMGYIAKSDGLISRNEIIMAQQIMREMHLSRTQRAACEHHYSKGKKQDFDLIATLNRFEHHCGNNHELIRLFITTIYRTAQVDGLSKAKIQVVNSIFRRLGFAALHEQNTYREEFANKNYSQNNRSENTVSQNLYQAYTILGLDSSATKEEVKRAYRRLISKNHPDKLIAKGLPEAKIKEANHKTQIITKAYEQITRSHGW